MDKITHFKHKKLTINSSAHLIIVAFLLMYNKNKKKSKT